jgi:prepilin signal peptidase PulO-like enzyme (type II secretory pathway)
MPKSIGEKILYILFFPVHLILYLLPNYLENPIPKKLVLCFFLNILLLCGCLFLVDWWVLEISKGTGIPLSILGILFTGICLSIHFIEYNIKVRQTLIYLSPFRWQGKRSS